MAPKSKPTWAGRIPGGLDPRAWEFLHSLPHDAFLAEDDLVGTMAHVRALEAAGVLTGAEARRVLKELARVEVPFHREDDEDVHSALERVLTERLGELGARVHAGRSRNDQVALDLRLWARREELSLAAAVVELVEALLRRAGETHGAPAPGYTHLQRAQPVTVAHWLLAHAWAFDRDLGRLEAAYDSADCSPLGAGALAGSTLKLDPRIAAHSLGFSRTFDNSLDAVSDRDFLLDAAYAAAVAATHLSRLAEELVLWSSAEFGFVRLPDAFATGSSMMPQKKNPDVAELARAQAGPATGTLVGLLVTLKALPLAYDRDLQADKQNLRGALESVAAAFRAMAGLVSALDLDHARLAEAAGDDALLATDLAEALVAAGVPFRRAHEQVGALARKAAEDGVALAAALRELPEAVAPLDSKQALALLSADGSLRRRRTPGGPSPASTRRQAAKLERATAERRRWVKGAESRLPSRA